MKNDGLTRQARDKRKESSPNRGRFTQTWEDPIGIKDIQMRWLPEFDKPLGEAKADAVYDKATALVTREFASGTHVTFNHTNNQGEASLPIAAAVGCVWCGCL